MGNVMPWNDERQAANGRAVKDNFNAWFGNSQVVDGCRAPLAVNHGTLDYFSSFKTCGGFHNTGGIYFAPRENDWYVHSYLESLKYRDDQHESRGDYFVMPSFLRIERPLRISTNEEAGGWADEVLEKDWVRKAKAKNHDGLIISDADHGTTFYVVFHPFQIKSSIGNSGLYLMHSQDVCDADAARQLELSHSARDFLAPLLVTSQKKVLLHA